MSATGEVQKQAQKPAEEKKNRVLKERKPRAPKTASHPPYFQMIKEALLALNERDGSSPYAIAKYMEEKHKAVLPSNFRKTLALQLKKNSVAKGKLIKIRASFKLSKAGKGDEGTKNKKSPSPTRKKETTRKGVVGPKKKPKKSAAAAAAAKPKQPKSIRTSSSSKKAKRVTA